MHEKFYVRSSEIKFISLYVKDKTCFPTTKNKSTYVGVGSQNAEFK